MTLLFDKCIFSLDLGTGVSFKQKNDINKFIKDNGGQVDLTVSSRCTHFISNQDSIVSGYKAKTAYKNPSCIVLLDQFIYDAISTNSYPDIYPYLYINGQKADQVLPTDYQSNLLNSLQDTYLNVKALDFSLEEQRKSVPLVSNLSINNTTTTTTITPSLVSPIKKTTFTTSPAKSSLSSLPSTSTFTSKYSSTPLSFSSSTSSYLSSKTGSYTSSLTSSSSTSSILSSPLKSASSSLSSSFSPSTSSTSSSTTSKSSSLYASFLAKKEQLEKKKAENDLILEKKRQEKLDQIEEKNRERQNVLNQKIQEKEERLRKLAFEKESKVEQEKERRKNVITNLNTAAIQSKSTPSSYAQIIEKEREAQRLRDKKEKEERVRKQIEDQKAKKIATKEARQKELKDERDEKLAEKDKRRAAYFEKKASEEERIAREKSEEKKKNYEAYLERQKRRAAKLENQTSDDLIMEKDNKERLKSVDLRKVFVGGWNYDDLTTENTKTLMTKAKSESFKQKRVSFLLEVFNRFGRVESRKVNVQKAHFFITYESVNAAKEAVAFCLNAENRKQIVSEIQQKLKELKKPIILAPTYKFYVRRTKSADVPKEDPSFINEVDSKPFKPSKDFQICYPQAEESKDSFNIASPLDESEWIDSVEHQDIQQEDIAQEQQTYPQAPEDIEQDLSEQEEDVNNESVEEEDEEDDESICSDDFRLF